MRSPLRLLVAILVLLGATVPQVRAQTLTANAGPDQQGMDINTTVNLNGTGSVGATTYKWTFSKRPSGSAAVLVNPLTATASFVPDRGGPYTLKLTVGNGVSTKSDTVVITTSNHPPVANAGADVLSTVAKTVTLNGTGSTDPDLNPLTYQWTLISHPDTSVSALTRATTNKAALFLDRPGTYVVQLVVKDGALVSAPDQVTISTSNTAPVSNAGPDRQVAPGSFVQLNGTASSDIDGNRITYAWTLKRPSGSTAAFDDKTSPMPTFKADKAGSYTATLKVSDGLLSASDSVVITTGTNRYPVARTKADDVAMTQGQTIQLDAGDSTDSNGGPLAYSWTITARPSGSAATISAPTTPRPTFTADRAGSYTFSLLVTDAGALTSTDPQVVGTPLPQANAGPDQTATVGTPVTLDGSRSSHLRPNAAIAYGWSLVSTPAGSTAEFDDPTDPQPHFTPDLPGLYIAELVLFDGTRLSRADTVAISTNGNLPPTVDLGPDRKVTLGALVTVDALAADPDMDALTFSWSLLSAPAGSAATLSAAAGTPVHITPDIAGDYIVQLTATDSGQLSAVDTLVITTGNTTPTVTGPADGAASTGVAVPLSAVASDPDGNPVTYAWSLISKPSGSVAAISSPSAAAPTFTPDLDGVYVVQVLVRDNRNLFAADAAVFRVGAGDNNPPLADAGDAQTVVRGAVVQLSGAGSSDPENQPLTYAWQLVSKPAGSAAVLNNSSIVNPHFTADLGGDYLVRLVVNDGGRNSAPSDVTITADASPTANAGPDQNNVNLGVPVNLTGAASTDPESQPLTYAWSFVSKPANSGATLGSPTSATPTFTPDVGGIYVVQLIVNDGTSSSAADTVTITTRRLLTFSPSSLSLSSGGSGQLTVTAAYASTSPLVVQLTSSNPNVATVPASVTILANQLSANFNVTGGANGGVLITANGGVGSSAAEAAVAVGARLVQWNVDANGAWELPSNWTGNAIPGAGDVVVIDRPAGNFIVTISQATAAIASLLSKESLNQFSTLTVNGPAAFDGPLNLNGTLNGTGSASVNGPFTWTAGTVALSGGVNILPGSSLTFPNNGLGRLLAGSSLTNHGVVAMGTGNTLVLQTAATITNASDGLWTVVDTGTFTSNGGGAYTLTNAGTLRKTGAGGLALGASSAPYSNTGTIDLQGGSVAMADSATLANSGQLAVAAGATFVLHNVTLATGTSFAGAGLLNMNGTTAVSTNLTITLPTTLSGTLTGSGTANVGAPFTWTSGSVLLAGGLNVLNGRTLTFPNNGIGRLVAGSSLTNHGTVAMGTGNTLVLQTAATITNASDGLWTVVDTGTFTSNGGGAYTLTNAGTLRKTGAGGLALGASSAPYSNTGTIDLQGGSVAMADSATLANSGQLAVAAGATFFLHNVTFAAGTSFAGAGLLSMNGTTAVSTNLTITLPTTLSGTLTGSGTANVGAPFTWTGGTVLLAGGLNVLNGQTLTFPNNGIGRLVAGSSLTNHGTVAMGTGNTLVLQTAATITNASDGLWTVVDTGTFTSNGGGAYTLTNAGTLRKTGAGGLALGASSAPYSNTGTIDLQGGSVAMADSATLGNSGQLAVAAGATFFLHNVTFAAGTSFAGAGLLSMNGTTAVSTNLTITLPTTLSGTLTGSGTANVGAPFTWTGGTVLLAGGLNVLNGQTLTFPNNGIGRLVAGSSLTNHGTVAMGTGNTLVLQTAATITNASDGLWTVVDTGTFTSNGGGAYTLTNAGTLRKTGAGGLALGASSAPYSNTGTIDLQGGSVAMADSATLANSGQLAVAAGATFVLHNVTLATGTSFAGAGLLNMNGTTTVTTDLTVTVPVSLSGTLTGSGRVRMAAAMSWSGGTLGLGQGLDIQAGRTLTFPNTGLGRLLLTGTSLRNSGTVSWTAGSGSLVYQGGSIAVRNESGALWTYEAGGYNITSNGGSTPAGSFTFLNAGTMQGAGNPTTTLSVTTSTVSFSNTGSVASMLLNLGP